MRDVTIRTKEVSKLKSEKYTGSVVYCNCLYDTDRDELGRGFFVYELNFSEFENGFEKERIIYQIPFCVIDNLDSGLILDFSPEISAHRFLYFNLINGIISEFQADHYKLNDYHMQLLAKFSICANFLNSLDSFQEGEEIAVY